MTPVLTSCVTMTPPSDSAATDSGDSLGQGSDWSGFWSISKSVAKSFHPDFDPGQRTDQSGGPWIQLKIQPKELALRLAQRAIPADSYFNTINQVAMACLALASLPGCGGQTTQDHNPGASKESPGTTAPTSPSTSPETPTSMRSNSQVESVVSSSSASAMSESTGLTSSSMLSSAQYSSSTSTNSQLGRMSSPSRSSPQSARSLASTFSTSQPTSPATTTGCRSEQIPVKSNDDLANIGKNPCYFPANGVEPFEYICYVLEELPYADTVEKLEALLPWNVKASGALFRNTSHSQTA